MEAAQDLYELLRQHLSTLGGDTAQCRIMVRVYSNFKGLSNTLAKLGLCGNEARSIATVACGFTRAQELFDFVDAGEVKEGADRKIEGERPSVNPSKQVTNPFSDVQDEHRESSMQAVQQSALCATSNSSTGIRLLVNSREISVQDFRRSFRYLR